MMFDHKIIAIIILKLSKWEDRKFEHQGWKLVIFGRFKFDGFGQGGQIFFHVFTYDFGSWQNFFQILDMANWLYVMPLFLVMLFYSMSLNFSVPSSLKKVLT